MNYSALYKEDYSNGEGVRVTLFVSGCSHGCKGCHNEPAQNPKYGELFTEETLEEILEALEGKTGLTITGGDPLFRRNRETVSYICEIVKTMHPDKDIWMWTGYKQEDVKDLDVMKYVDVLIDGKYERDLPPAEWRGSNNQNIIYLEKQ